VLEDYALDSDDDINDQRPGKMRRFLLAFQIDGESAQIDHLTPE
jgi:hypothetical protein